MVSGVMVIASFILLACAMYVADARHRVIGLWGLVMVSLIMTTLIVAVYKSNSTNRFWGSIRFRARDEFGHGKQNRVQMRARSGRGALGARNVVNGSEDEGESLGFYDVTYLRVFLATFVPQIAVVCCLIGFGARNASTASVKFGCS
jgi:hypothetical protein